MLPQWSCWEQTSATSSEAESSLTTWQSKSLAAFHPGLKIFSLQMTLPLDECPLQKVITLSLNLHFRNLKQWGKMTEKNKHLLFMTSPPSLCRYHINNGVRGRWTAWILRMRVQGGCKRCHDQEGAPTSHSFTAVTSVSCQDSPSELPGYPWVLVGAPRAWARVHSPALLCVCLSVCTLPMLSRAQQSLQLISHTHP